MTLKKGTIDFYDYNGQLIESTYEDFAVDSNTYPTIQPGYSVDLNAPPISSDTAIDINKTTLTITYKK